MSKFIPFIICLLIVTTSIISQADNQKANTMPPQKILGLRTTVYIVPNMEEAKAWYTKAFQTDPYFDELYYIGYNIGGYELAIQPGEAAKKTSSENVLTYWGVEDIKAQYDYFLSLGATSHEAPSNVGGELMIASVRDPWDNVIGLIYNPTFKLKQP